MQETDELEDEKSRLQKEIADLQKEKDKLELVLEAHRPICKIEDTDSDSDPHPSISSLGGIKMEPQDTRGQGSSTKPPRKTEKPKPKITIPSKFVTSSASAVTTESESLHTPVLTSTPSLTPFTAGMVFTYPSAPLDTSASISSQATSHQGIAPQSRAPEPCGIAHRRSSSSGDQSDHSLHSPTILTLWFCRQNLTTMTEAITCICLCVCMREMISVRSTVSENYCDNSLKWTSCMWFISSLWKVDPVGRHANYCHYQDINVTLFLLW